MSEFHHLEGVTRSLSYAEFLSEMQSPLPHSALIAISRLSWQLEEKTTKQNRHLPVFFAQSARAILSTYVRSNDVENIERITKETFNRWFESYQSIDERPSTPDDPNFLNRIKIAVSFESFGFQDDSFRESIGRYYVLYCRSVLGRLSRRDWTEALGVSIEEYFHIWISLSALSRSQNGLIGRKIALGDELVKNNFEKYKITPSKIELVINLLASPPENYSNMEMGTREQRELRRFDPNPLLIKPLVEIEQDVLCIPVPHYLNNAASNGLYFKGIDKWSTFTEDLGKEFEEYMGEHLKLLGTARIFRVARQKTGEERCDWIVLLDSFALLVETKIQRLSAASRAGGSALQDDIEKVISKPSSQINATVTAINRGDDDFKYIPRDFPLRGLVVSLEPFYLANSIGIELALVKASIPTTFASANELEDLVSPKNPKLLDSTLKKLQDDLNLSKQSVWEVLNSIGYPRVLSPIIEGALDSAPWAEI